MIRLRKLFNKSYIKDRVLSLPNRGTPVNQLSTVGSNVTITASDSSQYINWIPIYKFPYIHAISGLNKIKLYQAAMTSGGIPVTMLMESNAVIPVGSANVFAVLGVTGTIALCIFSALTRNFIGFVYTDSMDQPKSIKLSHVDFWGRRQNVVLPVDDLIAPGDHRKLPLDLWVYVNFRNSKLSYKLFHRHGIIAQPELFSWIFGDC